MQLIFEKSVPGRRAVRLPKLDVPAPPELPVHLRRTKPAELPEVSELQAVRHFTQLSRRNFSVDTNFYPLGSCTMKYNPRGGEKAARFEGFANLHPLLPQLRLGGMLTQGALEVLHEMDRLLSEILGMAAFTMQPMAGAHGELTGMMIIAAYHHAKGNKKAIVLCPDSAHGTNPASAAIAGYELKPVPTDEHGFMNPDALAKVLDDNVAGVMLTCPNTLGLFNPHVRAISDMVHEVDGLMYYDGANLNAILGKVRPGDLGFDVVHVNLHKTFGTPHGGGGPGAGPVGVCKTLKPYLPTSVVVKRLDGTYTLDYDRPESIGYIASFYGNFGVVLRAYAYILTLGREGLIRVGENAVLNARYVLSRLKDHYELPFDCPCMHEFVLSASRQEAKGVRALDIAKGLIDRGIHPPTVYFPLVVHEALMVEPTETECKETLDEFVDAMIEIAEVAETDPESLHQAPVTTPVRRLDEVGAARNLCLCV